MPGGSQEMTKVEVELIAKLNLAGVLKVEEVCSGVLDILSDLNQVVAKTRNVKWLRKVAYTAMKITGTGADEFPPSSSIPEFVRLLETLLRKAKDDDEVANYVTSALTSVLQKDDGFPAILSSGILPSVIDLLIRPDDQRKLQPTVFLFIAEIANQAGSSHIKTCEFFEALKGSTGMKHFHEIMKFAEPPFSDPHRYGWDVQCKYRDACFRFFACIEDAFDGDLRLRMTNAVMTSGLDHALLLFLPMIDGTLRCNLAALGVLRCIASVVDGEVALPLVLGAFWWSYIYPRIHLRAFLCMRMLIRYNSNCWDELIRSGGLREMMWTVKKNSDPDLAYEVVRFIDDFLNMKPDRGLEPCKKVAKTLNSVVRNLDKFRVNKPEEFPRLQLALLNCLHRIACVWEGRELIRENGWLKTVLAALSETDVEVQKRALDILEVTCGQEEGCCREAALKLGALDCLPPFMESQSEEMKKLAHICLIVFVRGKLTSSQALKALEMTTMFQFEEYVFDVEGEDPALSHALFLSRIEELKRMQRKWWQKLTGT